MALVRVSLKGWLRVVWLSCKILYRVGTKSVATLGPIIVCNRPVQIITLYTFYKTMHRAKIFNQQS